MGRITLLGLGFLAWVASAATVPWEQLEPRVVDRQVMVRDTEGISTRAVACGINDREILLLRENGQVLRIPRGRVDRVQVWSRATGVRKGLLWGAALGGLFFAIGNYHLRHEESGDNALALPLLGAAQIVGGGAGIGALTGAVSTVYQAPQATGVTASRGWVAPFKESPRRATAATQTRWPRSSSLPDLDTGQAPPAPAYLLRPTNQR
jgi:hypothetical protein